MTGSIEDMTRKNVSEFLPDAIRKALQSYRDFIEEEKTQEEAKDFSAKHAAGKAAIAHLELLIKLVHWVEIPDEKQRENEDLKKIIFEAQKELESYIMRNIE